MIVGTPSRSKRACSISNSLHVGTSRQSTIADQRRRRCAAPLAIAREQRVEQHLHRGVFLHAIVFAEALHHRQRVENIGESFGVARSRRGLGVVFGELKRIGKQERVEARRGAGSSVARIDSSEPFFIRAQRCLREQRRICERLLYDALAERGDRFGNFADARVVVGG